MDVDLEIEDLRDLLACAFGTPFADETVRIVNESGQAILRTPRTAMMSIEDALLEAAKRLNVEKSAETIGDRLPKILALSAESERRVAAQRMAHVRGLAGGEEFLRWLLGRADSDTATVLRECGAVGSVDFVGIISSLPGIADLADGKGPRDFESVMVLNARGLTTIAESWYRALAVAAWHIARSQDGTHAGTGETLGQALAGLSRLWQDEPELLPLLDDRLRIVRNSEAHQRTLIDVRAETITFVNITPKGLEQSLGPLTAEQAGRITQETATLCMGFQSAFGLVERMETVEVGSDER